MAERPGQDTEHTEMTFSGGQEVINTLNHNSEILASELEAAVANALIISKTVDNKKCFSVPLILRVDSASGRIVNIISAEEDRRISALKNGFFQESDMLAGIISPVASAKAKDEIDSDIVMVPALRLSAFPNLDPTVKHPEGKVLIDRPAAWVRNDQVALREDESNGIENLIPDPIERGVFLQSLNSYNNAPEPAEVSASE